MNIFIYSDESGVFDKKHNKYFVFGGLILIDSYEKELCSRAYSKAEKTIRKNSSLPYNTELKATTLIPKDKTKLFRSLNKYRLYNI